MVISFRTEEALIGGGRQDRPSRTVGEVVLEIPVEVLVRSEIEQLDCVATRVEFIREKPLLAVGLELHDSDPGQGSCLWRAEERIFDKFLDLIVEGELRLRVELSLCLRKAGGLLNNPIWLLLGLLRHRVAATTPTSGHPIHTVGPGPP